MSEIDPQRFGELLAAVEFLKQNAIQQQKQAADNAAISQQQHAELKDEINEIKISLAPMMQTVERHNQELTIVKSEMNAHGWKNIAAMMIGGVGLSGHEGLRRLLGL
jgi:ribonuclease HII